MNILTSSSTAKQSAFMQKIFTTWQAESDLAVEITSRNTADKFKEDPTYKYDLPSDESFYVESVRNSLTLESKVYIT